MLSSPSIDWLDHWFLALTRLAQRSLTLQPGNLLIRPALTLSVGFSMSITLHAATQARRLLALTAAGLPSRSESHPMDHDSNSSGHTKSKDATLWSEDEVWETIANAIRPGATKARNFGKDIIAKQSLRQRSSCRRRKKAETEISTSF